MAGLASIPDEEVHARLRHLFAKFRELRSAKAVMRHFQEANFLVPVRPLDGPSPHDVVWRPASNARILQILKNPAYAGAYVYGRRRRTPIGRRSGSRQGGTEAVATEDWPVCLKDAFPGYIDWEEFMANRGGSRTMSIATMRTAMVYRARATRCCKALLFVAGAAAAWGCIIPARTATILSIFVAPTSINMAGRNVRRCAPWASMRRWKDCYSKR